MICHVIGDSIAVGTAQMIPECHANARSGITSTAFVATRLHHIDGDLTVISLGANDVSQPTLDNLRKVRAGVSTKQVVWLLPNIHRKGIRDSIFTVAVEHNDRIIDTVPYVSGDHIHPTGSGYQVIAKKAINGL